MGTNFYLHRNVCEHCGVSKDDPIHIGKSSVGWVFALHVKENEWDERPASLDEWKALWEQPGNVIRNEYGESVSPADMLRWITQRRQGEGVQPLTEEWLQQNQAMQGPNGLARARPDRYTRHGEGTYDLHTREFT